MGRIATLSAFRWRELCKQLVCGLMNGFEMVLVTLGSSAFSFSPCMDLKYIVPSAHVCLAAATPLSGRSKRAACMSACCTSLRARP